MSEKSSNEVRCDSEIYLGLMILNQHVKNLSMRIKMIQGDIEGAAHMVDEVSAFTDSLLFKASEEA